MKPTVNDTTTQSPGAISMRFDNSSPFGLRMMPTWLLIWMLICAGTLHPQNGLAQKTPEIMTASEPEAVSPDLGEILNRLEKRYSVSGFTARFLQTSTLKAMDITDTAEGRIYIKQPGKMRWEYTSPEQQVIISDGVQLWIFRPDDNQVMIGNAPAFFGDGKGASFLSDIRKMRQHFEITLENRPDTDNHILKLLPRRVEEALAEVYLSVSWTTFDIEKIITLNAYADETRIEFRDAEFGSHLADTLFEFEIPEGVEILQLGQ